jgi:light-regulated signal transduction histidine kinase (bacteriophytochrome)
LRPCSSALKRTVLLTTCLRPRTIWKSSIENLLALSRISRQVEFGTLRQDGRSIYYIRDNGAGFDARHRERMFLPFQRLHSDKEFEGTGIGIAIAARVIQRHGAQIWAEGKTGEGATVYFRLE